MAKVLYNVGQFIGLNGTAILYTAEATTGGAPFIVYKVLDEGDTAPDDEYFQFMSKSALDGHMASNVATISSSVNFDSLLNVLPAGVLDGDGHVTIDNDTTPPLPRLFTNQAFFTLKGVGVAVFEGDTGKQVSGDSASRTGASTVIVNSNAKTITESFKEVIDWGIKNPVWVALIVLLGLQLFGVIDILSLFSKKKKKPTRRR